jgi:hypothetical protein
MYAFTPLPSYMNYPKDRDTPYGRLINVRSHPKDRDMKDTCKEQETPFSAEMTPTNQGPFTDN